MMKSALYGGGCPRGLWGRLVDALVRFKTAGRAWVDAGRPRDCDAYTAFCSAERDYLLLRDDADRWTWNCDQSEEWERVNRAFDPAGET